MKDKTIKKIIKRDFSSTMPNVLPNIDLETIEIKAPERGFSKRRSFVPRLAFASVLSLVAVLVFVLARGTDIIGPPIDDASIVFKEREEVYAVSAVSAVSLLHQTIESPGNQLFNQYSQYFLSLHTMGTSNSYLIDYHMETLNRHLNAIEPILNDQDQLGFSIEPSDLEGYEYKLVFSSFDLRHSPVEQVIYYNEFISGDEVILEGIIIIDDKTYAMEAEIHIDDDELELELHAYQIGNEDNAIFVTQEIKDNKQTFEYEFIQFGDTVFESKLEIVDKEEYITIELEYETLTETVEFDIKRLNYETHDVLYIDYEIESEFYDEEGFIVVEVFFDPETETHVYRYTITIDDETFTYDKNRIPTTKTKAMFEHQLDFIHLFTMEIVEILESNAFSMFDKTLLLDEAYDYERRLPIIYNDAIVFAVLQYNLLEDDDEFAFIGKLEINELVYYGEGVLEGDGFHYELEVTFYDLDNEDNYFELYEVYEDDYEFGYTLTIEGNEVFVMEVVIDSNNVDMAFSNGLSFTQALVYVDSGEILLSGTYEIEDEIKDEEGILNIRYVYDETIEDYYYRYTVTVRNVQLTYDMTNE